MKVHNGWEAFGVIGGLIALGWIMSHGSVSLGLARVGATTGLAGLSLLEGNAVGIPTTALSGR